MPKLTLSFGSGRNVNTQALLDGSVRPEGIDLVPTVAHPSELFWRQLRSGEFDVCEMSLSSLLIAQSRGAELTAIPVFPSRRFFHTELDAHVGAGIDDPAELAGKRIGVPEYQQTAAVWLRAVLEHDFGVPANEIEWFMERDPERSHGGMTGFTAPDGISLRRVPPDKSLAAMLASQELDAAFIRMSRLASGTNFIERSQHVALDDPSGMLRPAFGDGITEGERFVKAHGYIPINHTYVVRRELLERHRWLALNLCTAFLEAKRHARRHELENIPLSLVFRWEYRELTRRIVGDDPFPYGLAANRPALTALARHVYEQGLVTQEMPVDELFAETTRLWPGG